MVTRTALAAPDPEEPRDTHRKGKKNVNGEGHIRLRKDGRYEGQVFVDTTDGLRKRVSVYGKTWNDCHDKVVELQDQQRRGLPVATTTLTVAKYLNYWLDEVAKPAIRRTTFVTYESAIRLHIVPGLGRYKLKALTTQHIRTWLNTVGKTCQCCAQGKDAQRAARTGAKPQCCAKGECCKQYLSDPSVRHLLRLVRAALQDAVDEDLIGRNVAKTVQLRNPSARRPRSWDMAEATKFLAVAQRHRLAALWGVGLALGLRRGEALGLAWENVDLTAGRIKISQALYRIQGELVLEDVKTEGSAATIPLPRPLVELLKHHRKKQLEDRFRAGTDWQTSGLVFTTKLGAPIDPRNVNRMFAALCTKAGVRSIRVHDMRHSCATLLFALGVDAATVQRILRHSSITVTTSIYMEVIETVQREAVSRMDDLFGPRRSDNGS